MPHRKILTPLTWPVLSFAAVILLGSLALCWPGFWTEGHSVSWLDALFLSTSAVCVTGLSTLDIGTTFNEGGLGVMLALIQLGGLGITTYTSLIFVLWRNRVPFTDRLAVSQALLNNHGFDLRAFLRHVVGLVLAVELIAAAVLYIRDPVAFGPFSALFHAVSAFCNAGFSLFPDNLISFKGDVVVNAVIGLNIVLGGIGFVVLRELVQVAARRLRGRPARLSRYSRLVIRISLWLIFGGGALIWLVEFQRGGAVHPGGSGLTLAISSLFQSISARTAGFNSVDLSRLTDASLLILTALMFVGGSPGSCAGGIKTTTFRVLLGYMVSQMRGERQIVLGRRRAVTTDSIARALTLFFFTSLTVCVSVLLLSVTENGITAWGEQAATPLLEILFETVSALGTVGLSTGLTPNLTPPGKAIIILNMFIGRVGLITLLAALQSLRPSRGYEYPSVYLPIG